MTLTTNQYHEVNHSIVISLNNMKGLLFFPNSPSAFNMFLNNKIDLFNAKKSLRLSYEKGEFNNV